MKRVFLKRKLMGLCLTIVPIFITVLMITGCAKDSKANVPEEEGNNIIAEEEGNNTVSEEVDINTKSEEESNNTELEIEGEYIPLNRLPADYNLATAKKDKCVVYENSNITEGQVEWDKFVSLTDKGNPAMVRLAFYYTLEEGPHISKELYEETKDDYPVLYPMDLTFDGDSYTIKHYEEGKLISKNFKYMVKYEGKANPEATYSDYTYYVLVNDNTVTWGDIFAGMVSSQFDASIDHSTVYSQLIFK